MDRIYLDVKKSYIVRAPTLYDAILTLPDVERVCLVWVSQVRRGLPASPAFKRATIVSRVVEEEYSGVFDRKGALEFATKYTAWDGCDMRLIGGLLCGLKISEGHVTPPGIPLEHIRDIAVGGDGDRVYLLRPNDMLGDAERWLR